MLFFLVVTIWLHPADAQFKGGSREDAIVYSAYLLSGRAPFASNEADARQAIQSVSTATSAWGTDEKGPLGRDPPEQLRRCLPYD